MKKLSSAASRKAKDEAPDDAKARNWTVNAISERTGIDRRTIKHRLVNAGIYPPSGKTFAEILTALKPGEGDTGGIKEKKTFEEWRKLKLRNDRDEGKVIAREVIADKIRLYAARVRKIEDKLETEYPAIVAGLDVPQARIYGKRLRDQMDAERAALETLFI